MQVLISFDNEYLYKINLFSFYQTFHNNLDLFIECNKLIKNFSITIESFKEN